MFKAVSTSIAVGSESQLEVLRDIAQKGYRTVIDVCTAAEGNQLDQSEVKSLGLEYVSIPISPKNLNHQMLASFKQAVEISPQPTYIRCPLALRAGVFGLLTGRG